MRETPVCPECGVPEHITREHSWLSDGSIVQTRHQEHRMAFLETENFDPLYLGIGELVKVPIIPIIMNVTRRSTRSYIERLIPEEVRRLVRAGGVDIREVFEIMYDIARVMGYGNGRLLEYRFGDEEEDYSVTRFDHPCSKPIIAGTVAGTVEAYMGCDYGMTMEEKQPDAIEVKVFHAEHPREWKKRFWTSIYSPREGGVDLKRCETCGGPLALKGFTWNLRMGIIRSATTDRRMGLIAPSMMESVLSELEDELGPTIPEVVIEAQRRFVRGGFYRIDEVVGEQEMRDELALRGLGEIKRLSLGRRGVELHLDNPRLHLIVVGITQGLFELAFGIESRVEWELDEAGSLRVKVTPWR